VSRRSVNARYAFNVSLFNAGQKAGISRSANYLESTKTRVGLIKFSMAAFRGESDIAKGAAATVRPSRN